MGNTRNAMMTFQFVFLLYRETIQGVKAPVERTEEHFDPGAKFHVAADYQYIRYKIHKEK